MGRKNITARLKRLRKTRRELANASGYSLQYVYSTLNGKDRLTKHTESIFDDALRRWEAEAGSAKKETGK